MYSIYFFNNDLSNLIGSGDFDIKSITDQHQLVHVTGKNLKYFYIASFSIYTLKLWKISTSKRPFPIWSYFRWYFVSNFVHWNRKFSQSKQNFKNIYHYLPTFTFIRFCVGPKLELCTGTRTTSKFFIR